MTREELINAMPIIKAFINGETVQYKGLDHEWKDLGVNDLDLDDFVESAWRTKPEPKYRPFKDAKECRNEMQKHQPIGWITSQDGEVKSLIILIDNEGLVIGDRNNGVMGFFTATDLFKIKFADGTPFGVKEEE